ncbi:hypothetical protein DUI87_20597 [Hirundo rustica rustica]|uniref:ribonuclease H n=1 Tax=Hirundo rustica rustica TaxID=333673 RepID=A0A3M0JX48_HIRRU|nr:hypothetical protein DUI87_20597 [Hirundo rustica rustica]
MLEVQYELESKAAKWYTTLAIANAFFSNPLAAECRPQFAFTWRGVQDTWNRLPQGWKHSPTICHGLIQAALEKGMNGKWKAPYGAPRDRLHKPLKDKKYGEAWQIDYITLPQTHQGKRYVLTMVESTTGWLETYPVPHTTAQNTILGLEKQILWRHGTPEKIESDNGTHFKNSLINTWAREHSIEWVYHIPYHTPAAGKVEGYLKPP